MDEKPMDRGRRQWKEAVKPPRVVQILLSIACYAVATAGFAAVQHLGHISNEILELTILAEGALLGAGAGFLMSCPGRGAIIGSSTIIAFMTLASFVH